MDDETLGFAARLVGERYVRQSQEAVRRRSKLFRGLVEHRKLPEEGWPEQLLLQFVEHAASLDSNNFIGNTGAGEREGRVACDIVRRRHFGLSHGIGRSGDVAAVQPKAAGSSLIYKLTADLLRDLLRRVLGLSHLKGVLLLPMATGMTISLVLQCLRHSERRRRGPDAPAPKYVIWPRIDQKTCLKAIHTAGFEPVVVENSIVGDKVQTDMEALRDKLRELGPENVLCVLSTTSCFAPRVPDDVEGIAKLCAEASIAHVVNNAYGLQCSKICHSVNRACQVGRVDAVVQSSDKNLMVPVGGALVAGPDRDWIEGELSKTYPGRASMAPILDIFLTLMTLGSSGYAGLRKERIALVPDFAQALEAVAAKHGERLLQLGGANTISFAVSLERTVARAAPSAGQSPEAAAALATKFGSMLFLRGVSGARVVAPGAPKTVAGRDFASYGASTDAYPIPYVTLACAIGAQRTDLDLLAQRLDQTFAKFLKAHSGPAS